MHRGWRGVALFVTSAYLSAWAPASAAQTIPDELRGKAPLQDLGDEPPSPAAGALVGTLTLEVSPDPFSPDGDGRKDKTEISIHTSSGGELVVEVLDADDVIRTWNRTALPDETVEVTWNGKAGGVRVPDGTYVVRVTLTDALGVQQEATEPVIVDTKAPTVKWRTISPEPISDQDVMRFKFTVADRAEDIAVTVILRDRVATVDKAESVVSSGKRRILWAPRYPNGDLLFPGQYEARLVAHDDAGNIRRSKWKPWRVIRAKQARVFLRLGGTGRKVALTFDDCHFGGAWGDILDTLAARKVDATFFCPGQMMAAYPGLVRRTDNGGHTISSHAWDHAFLPGHASSYTAWGDILETLAARKVDATFFCPGQMMAAHPGLVRRTDNGGHTLASHAWDHAFLPGHASSYTAWRLRGDARVSWNIAKQTTVPFFRPPYGAYDAAVLKAATATGHARVVTWDVDPRDWARPGAGAIVSRVLDDVRPGSIVLLHTLPQTADALPAILTGLKKRNLKAVDLPVLFRAAGLK